MSSALRRIIRLQRQIHQSIRAEVRKAIGPQTRDLRSYYEAYKREFRGPSRHSSKDDLLKAAMRSNILLIGDYHTFSQSQKAAVRLLRELLRRKAPIALALELVPAAYQSQLNCYISGKTSESEFLEAMDYEKNWGFEWQNFRPLFELARSHKLEVLGLNLNSPKLAERDAYAAKLVADWSAGNPERILFVLFGDLHLARGHLPRHLKRELRSREARRRTLTVFQNSESLYWKLAAARAIHDIDVIALERDRFCIMNAAPWVKLQSYLEWAVAGPQLTNPGGGHRNMDDDDDASPSGPNLHEVAHDRLKHLVRALDLDLPANVDFTIQTVEDLSFLLRKSPVLSTLTRAQIKSVKYQVLGSRTVLIPGANMIYLPSPWVNSLSEGVTLLAHHALSNGPTLFYDPPAHFFSATLASAISYFGSKVLNHKRKCDLEADFQRLLEHPLPKNALPAEKLQRRAAKLVLSHCKAQRTFLADGRYRAPVTQPGPSSIALFLETARALGAIIGEKLYAGYVDGNYTGPKIQRLFRARLDDPPATRKLYLELVSDLEKAKPAHTSKLDLF